MQPIRLFLDTNVLIDYLTRREPYFEDVLKIQVMQAMGDVELWVAPHSFPDASYVLRKAIPPERFASMVEACLEFINVSSGATEETRVAAQASWNDFEDCFVYQCARRADADFIITRDLRGFEASRIDVLSPDGFVSYMEHEHNLTFGVIDL